MATNRKPILLIKVILACMALCAVPALAATTELHVVKYASDGTTVLNATTVTSQLMMANLPVR